MSIDFTPGSHAPQLMEQSQIKQAADDFEREWIAGNSPRIEDFVQRAAPDVQQALFRELLSREMRLRGAANDLDELLTRFPNFASTVRDLFYVTRQSVAGDTVQDTTELLTTTNRYSNLRLHRVGGMANLFLAHDHDLGRETIIKQLRDEFRADPGYAGQLEIEAEITSLLDHPGIVPVFGIGRWGEDPFYVMSVIKGGDLLPAIANLHANGAFNRRTRAKRDQLFHLLEHLCSACKTLSYAHDQGIVHCDIKPLNIMIGSYGETFVIDWGLARTFRPASQFPSSTESKWRNRVNTSKQISGFTPGYVSPEQHFGNGSLGPASDIYSLGATLYHILTNRPQLQGNEPDFADRLAAGRITPPRKIDPAVPKGLEAICLKAMHVTPGERYATAMQMANDLQSWMRDDEITAIQDSWSDRIFRWRRRHRAASVAMTTIMAVLLVVGVLVVSYAKQTFDARAERDKAEDRFDAALDAFEQLSEPLKNGERSRLDFIEPMAQDIKRFVDGILNDKASIQPRPLHLARVWELSAVANGILNPDLELQLQDWQKAEQLYESVAHPSAGNDSPLRLARNRLAQARLMLRQQYFEHAATLLKAAVTQFESLQQANPPADELRALVRYEADAHHEMGRCYMAMANYDEAERRFNAGRDLRIKLSQNLNASRAEREQINRDLARSYGFLGDLYLRRGQSEMAVDAYNDSLVLRKDLFEKHRRDAETCFQYARGLANFGEVELVQERNLTDAIAKLQEAANLQKGLVSDYPNDSEFKSDRAATLLSLAELEIALSVTSAAPAETRFENAQKQIRDAKTLMLADQAANPNNPSNSQLIARADLLLAETLLDVNPDDARRFAAEADAQLKGLKSQEYDELFILAVIHAMLGQEVKAKEELDLSVERGNKSVRRLQIHRKLGLRTIDNTDAEIREFDERIQRMK
ncbi:MAG: serine/threonine protein kinase [Planctomycetes bacterium]|nr:serine/threonine protein kinase [Planctomycetota bacterium]